MRNGMNRGFFLGLLLVSLGVGGVGAETPAVAPAEMAPAPLWKPLGRL